MKAKNQRLDPARPRHRRGARRGAARHVGAARPGRLFYAPGDVAREGPAARPGGPDRRHGPGRARSARQPDGVTIDFVVGDETPRTIPVRFTGITPDLFQENSGVVAEGRFQPDGPFVANEILAKHDENYMPPELARDGGKHKSETLRMIAEAGLAALWLAAALSLLQLFLGAAALRPGRRGAAARSCGRSRWRRACWPRIAFLLLIWLFLRTDLSVEAGRRQQPFGEALALQVRRRLGESRRLDAALGDGARGRRRAPSPCSSGGCRADTLIATLAAQAAIGLGFYAFLLFASNPFERLIPVPVEGNGLNPLLQDPGLAFHPPTLYFGYVGISIAFSFAVGALVTRDVGPAFARAMRPWVLGAWIFLTLGITAGSYWAYYELGWGGWWFWDPVENASLMPWLAATALLHSASPCSPPATACAPGRSCSPWSPSRCR